MSLAAADTALQECGKEVGTLEKLINKSNTQRVRSSQEKDLTKATAITWYRKHKSAVESYLPSGDVASLDAEFERMFLLAERASARRSYRTCFKAIRVALTSAKVVLLAAPEKVDPTPDAPPGFGPLVPDTEMQKILVRRWEECVRCIRGGADLAAIVMMGGLLEALLLARVLKEVDKSVVFKTAAAPKEKKTNKPLPLQEWTLNNYIDVARELEWISRTARDIGGVMRDYRNYVHPHKELSDRIVIKPGDSALMWEVAKSISRQLLTP
jgi:hypothetical protein